MIEQLPSESSAPSTQEPPKAVPSPRPEEKPVKQQALEISKIIRDRSVQPRTALKETEVVRMTELMTAGEKFPPVTVFEIETDRFVLADGAHRLEAATRGGRTMIEAQIRSGTLRDAILFAIKVNVQHGQRLSREERQSAVLQLLKDPEWGKWSHEQIGRLCGYSGKQVTRIAEKFHFDNVKVKDRTCRARGGGTRKMNIAAVGRKKRAAKQSQTNCGSSAAAQGPAAKDRSTGCGALLAEMLEAIKRWRNEPQPVRSAELAQLDPLRLQELRSELNQMATEFATFTNSKAA
jgi:ParB-like chromosome segregation protein Spo0J